MSWQGVLYTTLLNVMARRTLYNIIKCHGKAYSIQHYKMSWQGVLYTTL